METTDVSPAEKIAECAKSLGITITYRFIPHSQSRNKDQKESSLNWVALLMRGSRGMSFDYGAGCGHCPSYKQGRKDCDQVMVVNKECETGFECKLLPSTDHVYVTKKPIVPKDADVLSCISMDASVINHSSFEDWARDFGYETDSRKAEAFYQACLKQALELRALIGNDGLQQLQEACQDY